MSMLLPLHRLTSGLRSSMSSSQPVVRNTFVHCEESVETGGSDVPVKCVSNLLDGLPTTWSQDDKLQGHLDNIIGHYRVGVPGSTPPAAVKEESETPPNADDVAEEPAKVMIPAAEQALMMVPAAEPAVMAEAALPADRRSWSAGAQGHAIGNCKPCAWNWKPSGCSKGPDCEYCHMCDEGAIRRKKQGRMVMRRQVARAKAKNNGGYKADAC